MGLVITRKTSPWKLKKQQHGLEMDKNIGVEGWKKNAEHSSCLLQFDIDRKKREREIV